MASAPWPRPGAAELMQATGLSQISVPPTVQSSRFLNEPGSVALHRTSMITVSVRSRANLTRFCAQLMISPPEY